MKVYFAADHAGFEYKRQLLEYVKNSGYQVEDCGAFSFNKDDDYPEFIHIAAKRLSDDITRGIDSRAIVLGASGQGEAMVANRHKGVRCALYYGLPTTLVQIDVSGKHLDMLSSTREHNNANALSLAARFVPLDDAKLVVGAWLKKPFSGEVRHMRRIKQIDEIA